MKILGISGSPKKNGNSEQMINRVLTMAEKRGFTPEKVFLSEMEVKPCIACGNCRESEECPINDDMEKIYPELDEADAIIVASPVYFGSPTAQLKALFDRSVLLRRHNFKLSNKIGAGIAIGGSRNGGQEKTIQVIQDWMHIHGMVVVGDGGHFGGIVKKPFREDETGTKTLDDTIEKVCDLLEMMKKT
ncbi:flavodoxin family protein [Methanohalophilus sp. RSK]|uniref:flavodoxin family protein n=1 Tax=Methanohalophilus sp. RSK TaxID=2485783 RepID=UPI000F43C6D3|nr:flavodoxin family protein [Methanohalophilus sp. RSK]RNI11812.1 flavodoxin family protein [Methanohalophilus sp. RSK]